jgi:hypothetical protein
MATATGRGGAGAVWVGCAGVPQATIISRASAPIALVGVRRLVRLNMAILLRILERARSALRPASTPDAR